MARIIAKLTALGIFLKQFYFFSPKSLQIGDVALLFATGLYVLTCGIQFHRIDAPYYLFILLACGINGIYSILNGVFIEETIYLVFVTLIIAFLFRPILQEEKFLDYLQFAFRAALLLQLVLYVTNWGRWLDYWRYIGTFNDPNQYGFYVFIAFLGQHLIDAMKHKRLNWIWLGITTLEIITSGSTGMTIGMIVFAVVYFLVGNNNEGVTINRFFGIMAMGLLMILVVVFSKQITAYFKNTGIYLFQKNDDRMNAAEGVLGRFIIDRGLTRVIENPQFLLFGASGGLWGRFPIEGWYMPTIEIHSTMVALAFSYGIIPYSILIIWMVRNLRGIKKGLLCVYIALFVEAFTLVNHRQSYFWLMIMIGSLAQAKRDNTPLLCPEKRLKFYWERG